MCLLRQLLFLSMYVTKLCGFPTGRSFPWFSDYFFGDSNNYIRQIGVNRIVIPLSYFEVNTYMVYKVTSSGIIHSNNTDMFKCSSVTVIKLNENGSLDKSNLHNYISRLNV